MFEHLAVLDVSFFGFVRFLSDGMLVMATGGMMLVQLLGLGKIMAFAGDSGEQGNGHKKERE